MAFVDLCGSLWFFVDLCGSLWFFVDLCGSLWIFVVDMLPAVGSTRKSSYIPCSTSTKTPWSQNCHPGPSSCVFETHPSGISLLFGWNVRPTASPLVCPSASMLCRLRLATAFALMAHPTMCFSTLDTTKVASSILRVEHLPEPVASTQEEARRFLHAASENHVPLAVIADGQGKGRGTNERAWESGKGILVLTICIPVYTVRFC